MMVMIMMMMITMMMMMMMITRDDIYFDSNFFYAFVFCIFSNTLCDLKAAIITLIDLF